MATNRLVAHLATDWGKSKNRKRACRQDQVVGSISMRYISLALYSMYVCISLFCDSEYDPLLEVLYLLFIVTRETGMALEILYFKHVEPIHNHHRLDQVASQIQMPGRMYSVSIKSPSPILEEGRKTLTPRQTCYSVYSYSTFLDARHLFSSLPL